MMLPEDLQQLIAILSTEPAAPNHRITFDQTPQTRFYMCSCRTHVVSSENFFRKRAKTILCHSPVNVELDGRRLYHVHGNPIVDVYCSECNRLIGHKCVLHGGPYTTPLRGLFFFNLKRLLYWDGNQVVDGYTNQPVENN